MEEKAGRHAVEADNDPMLKTAVRFINASLTWTITRVIGLDSSMFRLLVNPVRQQVSYSTTCKVLNALHFVFCTDLLQRPFREQVLRCLG